MAQLLKLNNQLLDCFAFMGCSLLVRNKTYFLKNKINVCGGNSLFYLIMKALSGKMWKDEILSKLHLDAMETKR